MILSTDPREYLTEQEQVWSQDCPLTTESVSGSLCRGVTTSHSGLVSDEKQPMVLVLTKRGKGSLVTRGVHCGDIRCLGPSSVLLVRPGAPDRA